MVDAASRRDNDKAIQITNTSAAIWRDNYEKSKAFDLQRTRSVEEQFVLACAREPRRFQSRLQKILWTGPSARNDAEESERERWTLTLEELLRCTSTPMGQLIQRDPEKLKVLRACRRASTFRSRIRTIRKYLSWLTTSSGTLYPDKPEHAVVTLK